MAREDISYDYEDFGMTADQLHDKYLDSGEHPEFINQQYEDMVRENPEGPQSHLTYWDWVEHMVSIDDESIPGNDEQGNPIEDQPIPEGAVTIPDLDTFAGVIARWHIKGLAQVEHMLEMPEGYVAQYVASEGAEPVEITLEGDALLAFRMGVMTGTDAFMKLPFTYSLDEAAVEPEDAEPAP